MIIDEPALIGTLQKARSVLLIEPPYRRKYPPLGLAKIAAFIRRNGGKVTFSRTPAIAGSFDLVCVTSLFTGDSELVMETLRGVSESHPGTPVILGGIFATLMSKFVSERWKGMIFPGYSRTLDEAVPDYSLDWQVDAPWDEFSFVFTSRGCPNRCPYCAVRKLEPAQWINPNWRDHILPNKPYVMVSDNNLSACPVEHLATVVDCIVSQRKKVVFDNGFDCKLITPEVAAILARARYTRFGCRLAFDRIEEDGIFQTAVRRLISAGVARSHIMAYVLFNFSETPKEADYRMRECVLLGIRPYPQRFQPLNWTARNQLHVGRYWTPGLLRAFRYYWLMKSLYIYSRMSFEEYMREPAKEAFRLTDDDWDHWASRKAPEPAVPERMRPVASASF